ncbi:MAG: DHA2 family efflux MFS transporter permease subunit [Leptospirillia bacterium]
MEPGVPVERSADTPALSNPGPVITAAVGATVLETLDSTVVNVGLPNMMGGLDTTIDGIAWVITAYTIGNVLMIPMTRYLSDRLGRRRYFTLSIILFTLFSLLCGLSRDLLPLVVFRLLQGMSGAAFFATSQTLIIDAFPPEKVAMANAIFGIGVSLGPALGPVVGGYLIYNHSWPWIFFINLPTGIFLTYLSYRYVPDSHHSVTDEPLDLPGILFLVGAIPGIQFALENGQRYDWFSSPDIRLAALSGILFLSLFVVRELTARHPLLDLRVLKNRSLWAGSAGYALLGSVYFGTLFTIPLMGEELFSWDPLETGFVLLQSIISFTFATVISGSLMGKVPVWMIMVPGVIVIEIALWGYGHIGPTAAPHSFLWPNIFRGIGLALLFPPLMTMSLATLPRKMLATGAAVSGMIGQLGGSIGIALLATLLQRSQQVHQAYLTTANLTANRVQTTQAQQTIISHLSSIGIPPGDASRLAIGLIEKQVSSQALFLSFSDVYAAVAVAALILLGPIFLFERSPREETPPPPPATG